jgi:hypothetical protein
MYFPWHYSFLVVKNSVDMSGFKRCSHRCPACLNKKEEKQFERFLSIHGYIITYKHHVGLLQVLDANLLCVHHSCQVVNIKVHFLS